VLLATEFHWILAGEAEVQIRVTDMNDNAPFFKERVYTARVPENTDPGAVIMTVNAEDKDEGSILFSLEIDNHFTEI